MDGRCPETNRTCFRFANCPTSLAKRMMLLLRRIRRNCTKSDSAGFGDLSNDFDNLMRQKRGRKLRRNGRMNGRRRRTVLDTKLIVHHQISQLRGLANIMFSLKRASNITREGPNERVCMGRPLRQCRPVAAVPSPRHAWQSGKRGRAAPAA